MSKAEQLAGALWYDSVPNYQHGSADSLHCILPLHDFEYYARCAVPRVPYFGVCRASAR